ncbi:uncharacterized protein LOC114916124 isoform X2 [Cajanus cajan]|uniref:uncharacterized protein LOC114916124 isoform X2 n=1 Tax=Cajanus cajan TaxID=3821 RepID=UPI0010FB0255|nr:uncharacterized protein LOC114916124 isoform X2 [Cajanus cajan]
MYDCLFRDLGIVLPFHPFFTSILRILNVAPTQLHPNSWASMQAFWSLCKFTHVKATFSLFLFHYYCRPAEQIKWVSLARVPSRRLLKPFTSSYKKFKVGFFKVCIHLSGQSYFFDNHNTPLFPFYWTRTPLRYDILPHSFLTPGELSDFSFLESLPRDLPCRRLIDLLKSPNPIRDLEVRKEHAKVEAAAATTTPSLGVHPAEPLVDVVPHRVEKKNPSKDKDKGPKHRTTERMETEAEAGMRAKKQKHLTPYFIGPCTLPPTLTSSHFLNPTINTREVLGQGFISPEGRNFLSQENSLTK